MEMFKRIVPLILAILMVVGGMAVAFPAFAAGTAEAKYLEIKSVSNSVQHEGTPDASVWEMGTYTFTCPSTSLGELGAEDITIKNDSGDISTEARTHISDISIQGFTFGGITFSGNENADLVKENMSFTVKVGKKPVEPAPKRDAYITSAVIRRYSKEGLGSAVSGHRGVQRGDDVNIELYVVDPNYKAPTDFKYSNPNAEEKDKIAERRKWAEDLEAHYTLHTNSFNDQNAKNDQSDIEVMPSSESIGGKLTFHIVLRMLEYTGVSNDLTFDLDYIHDNKHHSYSFSRSFPECVTYSGPIHEDDDDDDTQLDPLTPHIIVSNYNYGARQVTAGQNFSLSMDFQNTSDRYTLENIIMQVDAGEGFSISNASNTYYIDRMDEGDVINKTLGLQAMPNAKAQSYPISIRFSFQYVANDSRKSGESSESISIPISQPDRFQVDEIQTPTALMVGEEFPLSLSFVNKGKADVYNVSVELKGNMSNAGERQFVGNVGSGTENSVEFYISGEEEGKLEGEILLSYEDGNMNIKEVSKPFSIQVDSFEMPFPEFPEPEIPTGPVEPVEPEPFWNASTVGLTLASVVIAVLSCYLTVMKIKARRSEEDDEIL